MLVSRKFREKYIEDEAYFSKIRFTSKLDLSKLKKCSESENLLKKKNSSVVINGKKLSEYGDNLTLE